MPDKTTVQLFRTAVLTFEELGFLLPSEEIDARQAAAALAAVVHLDFTGPFAGTLELRFYGDLLPELAANMLGEEEPPPFQEQLDALGEVTNVICGNLLPAIAGREQVFDLCEPRVAADGPPAGNQALGELQAEAAVGLAGGRAELSLYVRADAVV
ncbi:MAG: chemotaxis protein CheX [Candidatus Krumholzibacteriota bacterium]|nr:chemotaxis protein CheX [Candidatus Krumholzibacteriota bacterium]